MSIKERLNLGGLFLFILLCAYIVYFVPKPKYQGKAFTEKVIQSIPSFAGKWKQKEESIAGGKMEGDVYNFISRIFVRHYKKIDEPDKEVLLVVLDAGNFHYPKICFRGAGFKTEELRAREVNIAGKKIKMHA